MKYIYCIIPALTSIPPPPQNEFIYLTTLQKTTLLYYKMSYFFVKLNIFFVQKLANGGKTSQKAQKKYCNENSANFYFDVMNKSITQKQFGANKG